MAAPFHGSEHCNTSYYMQKTKTTSTYKNDSLYIFILTKLKKN